MKFEELFGTVNENIITVDDSYSQIEITSGRKRIRTHQLSWEEKIQRKKLRNRIAAQTSRDRKKAHMDHLEGAVKELQRENMELHSKIKELQEQNESLLNNNAELHKVLSTRNSSCTCQLQKEINKTTEKTFDSTDLNQSCVSADDFLEVPAVSSTYPQQKGRKALAQDLMDITFWTVWKIFILCLLIQKCLEISKITHSLMIWRDWLKLCFKKLNSMEMQILHLLGKRHQKLMKKNSQVLIKWWGKHQKCWNPVQMMT